MKRLMFVLILSMCWANIYAQDDNAFVTFGFLRSVGILKSDTGLFVTPARLEQSLSGVTGGVIDSTQWMPLWRAGLYAPVNDPRLSDARLPLTHSHIVSEVTGLQTVLDGKQPTLGFVPVNTLDSRLSDARPASDVSTWAKSITKPSYTYSEVGSIASNDARLTDARIPLTHAHAEYEPANVNIQSHVGSVHAPSNAQKNSDITKAEIEAKLTGEISTHTHAGGGGGLGYTINVQALTSSPADGGTVYFGMLPKAPTTTANISKVYIRKAGTIKIANIYCYSGTAGTAETWSLYVRKNNTTDYLIATLTAAASERVFTNSALSITVIAGDYIEIKSVQPTWVTNPLTTIYSGYIYIE